MACSIGLRFSLKRREDVVVPSWPLALTRTPIPPAEVVAKTLPMKQLLLTFWPGMPMQIALLAVVTLIPALAPMAVLLSPRLFRSAIFPTAVLFVPMRSEERRVGKEC